MNRLALSLLVLAACKTPLPDEPPIVIVDASDAAALLDAGPDAGPCALACASMAAQAPPCREANGACLVACERARAHGILSDITIGCVAAAKDRDAMHACGTFCP